MSGRRLLCIPAVVLLRDCPGNTALTDGLKAEVVTAPLAAQRGLTLCTEIKGRRLKERCRSDWVSNSKS